MKRAIITVGLGFGDEGKGATVDYLCRRLGADLVVRYGGGSQAGHNVQLPDGRRHTFSQFGAGTLAGVPTYLGRHVIIHPTALAREADHLGELGVADPYATLAAHPRCLVSTWFHQTANQLRELARGEHRHGSCGHGIGETRRYWLRHGDDAVFAEDLRDRAALREKLELLRQRLFLDLQEVADKVPADVFREYDLLDLNADSVAEPLLGVGTLLHVRDTIPDHATAIYEGAQGVLLDEWYGFHPYTTWSTVTPHHALEMAVEGGAEEVCVLGVVRGYATRHGAGPFPSYDERLTARIKDEGNPWNKWQGSLRAGWLDLLLLRYAARACSPVDNLAVSCLDHLDGGEAQVCVGYENCKELPLPAGPNLAHQERLTKVLEGAVPVYRPASEDAILGALGEVAPVAVVAHGPTHRDRDCTTLRFRKRVAARRGEV
jgi:adenylosuccinate synthase